MTEPCNHEWVCGLDQQQCMEDCHDKHALGHLICRKCGCSKQAVKEQAPVPEDLVIRCHDCGGTMIWKREGGEVVVYHGCFNGKQSRELYARLGQETTALKAKVKRLEAPVSDVEWRLIDSPSKGWKRVFRADISALIAARAADPGKCATQTVQPANVVGNQCDGCRLGLPIENGNHVHPEKTGWERLHMACTARLYTEPGKEPSK